MTKLLLTLLAALSVLGSPLMREWCLVACTSPSAHAQHDGAGSDHACHESDTSSAPSLGAVPHGCEHDSPDPPATTAIAADLRCTVAPALAILPSTDHLSLDRMPTMWLVPARDRSGHVPRPVGAPVPLRI